MSFFQINWSRLRYSKQIFDDVTPRYSIENAGRLERNNWGNF